MCSSADCSIEKVTQEPNQKIFIFKQHEWLYKIVFPASDLSYGTRHPQSALQHVGSSSLAGDQIGTLCVRSSESEPLDHQEALL